LSEKGEYVKVLLIIPHLLTFELSQSSPSIHPTTSFNILEVLTTPITNKPIKLTTSIINNITSQLLSLSLTYAQHMPNSRAIVSSHIDIMENVKKHLIDSDNDGHYSDTSSSKKLRSSHSPGNGSPFMPTSNSTAPPSPPAEVEVIDLSSDLEIVPKRMLHPGKEFPIFETGDVYIDLRAMGPNAAYRLHSSLLSFASEWFQKTLSSPFQDLNERVAAGWSKRSKIVARYEISYNSDPKIGVLFRSVGSYPDLFIVSKNICSYFTFC
jgi:hypothetical protein